MNLHLPNRLRLLATTLLRHSARLPLLALAHVLLGHDTRQLARCRTQLQRVHHIAFAGAFFLCLDVVASCALGLI